MTVIEAAFSALFNNWMAAYIWTLPHLKKFAIILFCVEEAPSGEAAVFLSKIHKISSAHTNASMDLEQFKTKKCENYNLEKDGVLCVFSSNCIVMIHG